MGKHHNTSTIGLAAKAFTIFSNEIINDITQQSAILSKENERLRPLRDYLNTMEILVDNESIASCNFDSAKVDECPHCACGQKVASWDVSSTSTGRPTLLSHATKKNGMKIAVSGQRVGDFASYHPLFMVWSRSPFICICHLMSAGSGHSVYGRLLNLSEEVRRSGHTCLYLFFYMT